MDFIRDDVYFFINKGRLIVPVRQTKIYPQAGAAGPDRRHRDPGVRRRRRPAPCRSARSSRCSYSYFASPEVFPWVGNRGQPRERLACQASLRVVTETAERNVAEQV